MGKPTPQAISQRKYAATPRGKAARARAQLRYYNTAAGKRQAISRERARKSGISVGMFETLMQLQGGCCAICARVFDKKINADHCHDTGQSRGLLCTTCNTIEGKIKKMGFTPLGFAERLQRYLDAPPARIAELV